MDSKEGEGAINPDVMSALVKRFLAGDESAFSEFEEVINSSLDKLSRELPADFYSSIVEDFIELLPEPGEQQKLVFKLVIDSNIIVMDSFRVARGRASSTERILASPFLEVHAPLNIDEEVERNIKNDLPKGGSLEKALSHAQSLLRRVKRSNPEDFEAISKARNLISSHSPEDVPFLALAIERRVAGIVSRDKTAFDPQDAVRRWELTDAVRVVASRESGALSYFIVGESLEGVVGALEEILLIVLQVASDSLKAFVQIVDSVFKQGAAKLSEVPAWAKLLALAVIGAASIALVATERGQETISKVWNAVQVAMAAMVDAAMTILEAIKTLFAFLWESFEPLGALLLVSIAILLNRAHMFLRVITEGLETTPT